MLRLFAAVEAPSAIAETLTRRQQGLPGARCRPQEAMHITLAFYVDIRREAAAELDEALGELRAPPFELELSGVGAFGEGGDVRAIWAGVARSEALNDLAARCRAAGRRAGVAFEKRAYRPHLTLAYLHRPDPDRVAAWIASHNLLHSPPFTVEWFGLWSSWLSKEGSRYELERDYPLRP
jgi:2'-5' RNA ligase